MRTAGFPCRLLGCDHVFQVIDQSSMEALRAASAKRTEHEVAAHDYHHVSLSTETGYRPQQRTIRRPSTSG